jgi:hypothetical protein
MNTNSLFMSPQLEDRIDLYVNQKNIIHSELVQCTLFGSESKISGRLLAFENVHHGKDHDKFSVSIFISTKSLQDALGITEYRTIDISIDGITMISRVIPDGWIQHKIIRPNDTGAVICLSVMREDK